MMNPRSPKRILVFLSEAKGGILQRKSNDSIAVDHLQIKCLGYNYIYLKKAAMIDFIIVTLIIKITLLTFW